MNQTMYRKYIRVDNNELDYLKSEHAMAIQDSKYVKIENNRERIFSQHSKSQKKHNVQSVNPKDGYIIKH